MDIVGAGRRRGSGVTQVADATRTASWISPMSTTRTKLRDGHKQNIESSTRRDPGHPALSCLYSHFSPACCFFIFLSPFNHLTRVPREERRQSRCAHVHYHVSPFNSTVFLALSLSLSTLLFPPTSSFSFSLFLFRSLSDSSFEPSC